MDTRPDDQRPDDTAPGRSRAEARQNDLGLLSLGVELHPNIDPDGFLIGTLKISGALQCPVDARPYDRHRARERRRGLAVSQPADITLTTSLGWTYELDTADAAAGCSTCDRAPRVDEVMLLLKVWQPGDGGGRVLAMNSPLCADCIGEALAVHFGRRVVQDGAELSPVDEPSSDTAVPADASASAGDQRRECACRAMGPLDDGLRCVHYRGGDRCALDQVELLDDAASGEDHGACPACQSTSVTRHANGIYECLADQCNATWSGRRKVIEPDGF